MAIRRNSTLTLVIISVALIVSACRTAPTPKVAGDKLPAGIPRDFPVPPKAKFVSSEPWMGDAGQSLLRVVWRLPAQPADVYGFYIRELPKKGWGHKVLEDFSTKVIEFWRQNEYGKGVSHLVISPIDPSGMRTGAYLQVEIAL